MHIAFSTDYQDWGRVVRLQELVSTCQRRYDFVNPNLNPLVLGEESSWTPVAFWGWLVAEWGPDTGAGFGAATGIGMGIGLDTGL